MSRLEESMKRLDQVADTILGLEPEYGTISEAEFVSTWLPAFIPTVLEESKFKLDIRQWVDEVAKRPTWPVNVIDDNGEVIYQVPALLNTDVDSTGQVMDSEDLSVLLAKVKLFNDEIPNSGIKELKAHLEPLRVTDPSTESYLKILEIASRYITQPEAKTEGGSESIPTDPNEGFDDDDIYLD